jgi:hypothetical protein
MNSGRHGFAGAFVLSAALLGAAFSSRGARAQDSAGAQCSLRGTPALPATLEIYDKPQGGKAVARFTGGTSPVVFSDFPSSPATRRVSVHTGNGSGSFRIEGYVEAAKLPLHTAQTVAVAPAHVWIGAHQEVSLVGASSGRLKVRRAARSPLSGNFDGSAACSAFGLVPGTPAGWNVPGEARGYVLKQSSLDLHEGPGGSRVTTLQRSGEGGGVLFFSTERRGDWVRIEYRDDIVIDAWARSSNLHALPPGETMDFQRPPTTQRGTPRVLLQGSTRTVKTTKEIPLRIAAKDAEPVIGKIEANTETYVMDVMAGWASVLPKALNVAPAGELQFWVPAKELGL